MKRLIPILVCATVLSGCQEMGPPVAVEPQSLDAGAAQRSGTEVLYGSVVLYPLPGSSDIVVAVDGGERGAPADGYADVAFVLQRGYATSVPEFTRVERARVVADPAGLVVTSASGNAYVAGLFLGSKVGGPGGRLASSNVAVGRTWTGYGLARRTGKWQVPVSASSDAAQALGRCSRQPADAASPLFSQTVCTSGGVGSTSCSTYCPGGGNCSVTCDDGYYSCCDKVYCVCTCTVKQIKPNVPG
ncbi:MAG TPA: hypothetical protein VF746_23125 [Longimicrobium sp.]|jgi:hypothetical protein